MDTPSPVTSKAPYIWLTIIIVLAAGSLVLAVLLLRPNQDPLDLIGKVAAGVAPTIAAAAAYLKSQETHLSVNSRLDAWMKDHASVARSEGVQQGITEEQTRAAAMPTAPMQVAVRVDPKTKNPL